MSMCVNVPAREQLVTIIYCLVYRALIVIWTLWWYTERFNFVFTTEILRTDRIWMFHISFGNLLYKSIPHYALIHKHNNNMLYHDKQFTYYYYSRRMIYLYCIQIFYCAFIYSGRDCTICWRTQRDTFPRTLYRY